MYPEMNIREFDERCKTIRHLSRLNTDALKEFIHLSPAKKKMMSGSKPDGSAVTILDYSNNFRLINQWLEKFPEDDINGEELAMRKHKHYPADYEIFEDPLDSTHHGIEWDKDNPSSEKWPTHMISLTYRGEPVAFALGVPLKDEYYFGSVSHGVVLNDQPYKPTHTGKEQLLLGVNELEDIHVAELTSLTGRKKYGIAGLYAWIILQGVTAGGINPYPLPHESVCIAAVVRAMGGSISNEFGQLFQAHNRVARMVWSFPPVKHEDVLRIAREKR